MKEFSLELEPKVKSAIDSVDYPYDADEGLIQNEESITLDAAKDFNPLLLLRWKQRECIECHTSFDIALNGLLYKCGECVA